MEKVSITPQMLTEGLQQDFNFELGEPKPVEVGLESLVYQAQHDGEQVFIRINHEKGVYPLEAELYKRYAEIGVPVPRVLAVNDDPELIGYPTIVLSQAPGKPLAEIEDFQDQEHLYFKAGEMLAKMHQLKVDGFGWLILEDGNLKGKSPSYKKFWETDGTYFSNVSYLRENNLVTASKFESIMHDKERITNEPLDRATVLHHDFNRQHIFTDGEEITGIIDLGDAMAGDPRYDIAIALVFQNPKIRQAFIKGYGELAKDPMVNTYLLFVAAYKFAFRHQRGMVAGAKQAEETIKLLLD